VALMDSSRRVGSKDSLTRARLLDAAEQLMLEEGYAAVTSRRVGRTAGISPQLVHYYFRTMDDLFLEVFRRRADEGFARFQASIAADPSLRTVWRSMSDGRGSAFNVEFAALANHRKAIRAEMASSAERFRSMQLDAISAVLAPGDLPGDLTPEVVLVAMVGVSQLVAIERALGVSGGHEQTLALIERFVDASGLRGTEVAHERG
jgi:TetR/AcrR family transcriptional regulator